MRVDLKAHLVSITGRISHSQWNDTHTGGPRKRHEIIADRIGYLDSSPAQANEPATDEEEAF